jgi:hypothetical protein
VPADSDVPQRSTRERIEALIEKAGIAHDQSLTPEQVQAAREAGLEVDELIEFVAPLFSECRGSDERCRVVDLTDMVAVALLVELEGARGLEIAMRFALLGDFHSDELVDTALERRVLAAMEQGVCEPPHTDELAAAREDLVDFRVLEATAGGKLRARKLEATELDDLAYFMAAVVQAGTPVGEPWEDDEAAPNEALIPELKQAKRRWEQSKQRGDLDAAFAAGEDYLELLGWPEPIHIADEISFAWGGAAYSYLMRDMAKLAELRGRHEQARQLWTRANPGGGACGSSASYYWHDQLRGSIRTAEILGDCRPTIAERLLDIDAYSWWTFGEGSFESYDDGFDYGVRRLAAAGFDLARLYRGALLTRNRELDPLAIADALVGPEREPARARLLARGSEDWEWRVRASEGLADTIGEPALEPLLALLPVANPELRARVIEAIGRAGRRFSSGACDPEHRALIGEGSNIWHRVVRPFGHDCSTRLDDRETSKLARQLRPYLGDDNQDVRVATAGAFVHLLALDTLPALRELERAARDAEDEWFANVIRDDIQALEEELAAD